MWPRQLNDTFLHYDTLPDCDRWTYILTLDETKADLCNASCDRTADQTNECTQITQNTVKW